MGGAVSVNSPQVDDQFANLFRDDRQLDQFYQQAYEDAVTRGEQRTREDISLEELMAYIGGRFQNNPFFSKLLNDPRIVHEAYKFSLTEDAYWAKDLLAPEGGDPELSPRIEPVDEPQPDPGAKKKRAKSIKYGSKAAKSIKVAGVEYVTKVQFRSLLPAIHLFSCLWEIFKAADNGIGNRQVTRQEYSESFNALRSSNVLDFSQITEEDWLEEFDEIDSNSNGSISFDELCFYAIHKIMRPDRLRKIQEAEDAAAREKIRAELEESARRKRLEDEEAARRKRAYDEACQAIRDKRAKEAEERRIKKEAEELARKLREAQEEAERLKREEDEEIRLISEHMAKAEAEHQARLAAEEAERRRLEAEAEAERARAAAEAARLAGLNLVKLELKARLDAIGKCPANYYWVRKSGGYVCSGGGHTISDKELAAAAKNATTTKSKKHA